jgi:hypothetical protein
LAVPETQWDEGRRSNAFVAAYRARPQLAVSRLRGLATEVALSLAAALVSSPRRLEIFGEI